MTVAAVLCVITMLRVDWDKEALKAKERLQVRWLAAAMCGAWSSAKQIWLIITQADMCTKCSCLPPNASKCHAHKVLLQSCGSAVFLAQVIEQLDAAGDLPEVAYTLGASATVLTDRQKRVCIGCRHPH